MHRVFARGCRAGNDLGDIQSRTTADADDQLRALGDLKGRVQMRKLRLAGKIGKHRRFDACAFKLPAHLLGKAGLGQKAVNDENSTLYAIKRGCGRGETGEDAVSEADFGNG